MKPAYFCICLVVLLVPARPVPAQSFSGTWIGTSAAPLTPPNTWHCFRRSFPLGAAPARAVMRLAVDSRYWLWINGRQVVYEGGLKRGPNPRDTYYDEVDIAPYLRPGANTVAVLAWFWGGKGFTHNNSGRCALYADCPALGWATDAAWKAAPHPGYVPSTLPRPNFRLSEPSIAHDARRAFRRQGGLLARKRDWFSPGYDDSAWPAAVAAGTVPGAPWNQLVRRPIPLFKDWGLRDYVSVVRRPGRGADTLVGRLPYDAHVSPLLTVRARAGRRIVIGSDTYYMGALGPADSLYTLGSEYTTRRGRQTYESLGWLSGHEIRYVVPHGVKVKALRFRETGYHTAFAGSFACNDSLLTRLWAKAQRTLYVNMRDNYMDCPDRERAQWAADGAMQMAEAFYALDTASTALGRKLFLDVTNWQKPDSVLYSPVPESDWKQELPAQSLMTLSETERYFRHTRDTALVRHAYPALRRYLALWRQFPSGQLVYRRGGWDWGDWGENQDVVLIQHAWYVRALQTAAWMARLLGHPGQADAHDRQAASVVRFLNGPDCWTGTAYRHCAYTGLTDDRTNALMVVAGVAEPAKWPALTQVLEQQAHASPWMEKFVLESLFRMGRPEQALDRMRRRYRPMTEAAYTTLWELWQHETGGNHGNTGYNHGWSGGPLVLLSEYVAGVSPDPARAGGFRVRPLLAGLTHVRAAVPTPHGTLRVEVVRSGTALTLTLDVPPGTPVTAALPAGPAYASATLDGRELAEKDLPAALAPGRHVLQGRLSP